MRDRFLYIIKKQSKKLLFKDLVGVCDHWMIAANSMFGDSIFYAQKTEIGNTGTMDYRAVKKIKFDSAEFDENEQLHIHKGKATFKFTNPKFEEYPEFPTSMERLGTLCNHDVLNILNLMNFTSASDLQPAMQHVHYGKKYDEWVATNAHILKMMDYHSNLKSDTFMVPNIVEPLINPDSQYTVYEGLYDDNEYVILKNDKEMIAYPKCTELYPNYPAVLPKGKFNLYLNRNELYEAIESVKIINPNKEYIEFKITDKKVEAHGYDIDLEQEINFPFSDFSCDIPFPMNFAVKGNYLKVILDNDVTEDRWVQFNFSGRNPYMKPIYIQKKTIIMPVIFEDQYTPQQKKYVTDQLNKEKKKS